MIEASRVHAARRSTLAIFLVNGALLSSWVPHIPQVQKRLEIGEATLGLALLAMAIGAIGAMPLSAYLCAKHGSKGTASLSAITYCLVMPLPIVAPDFFWLVAALLAFGACNGALDVSMNSQAVQVDIQFEQPTMSAFHGFFSVGSLIGVSLGGFALAKGMSPLAHATAISGLCLIVSAFTIRGFLGKEAAANRGPGVFTIPKGRLVGLGLLAFLVLVVEGAMADWSALYLTNSLQAGPGTSAAGYAAFSLMMAVGRLYGDRFVARLGPATVTRLTSSIAGAGLGAALLIHHPVAAIIGFGSVGLGVSNLIPVIFNAAGRTPGFSASTGIAAVSTTGYFGFLAGPPVIGFVAELFSLPLALSMLVVLIFLVFIFARLTAHE